MPNSAPDALEFTPEHLHYLSSVLGLRSFIRSMEEIREPATMAELPPVLIGGSEPRLLALFPLPAADFPLRGDTAELVGKMIRAMKLEPRQALLAEWICPLAITTAPLPDGIRAAIEEAAQAARPVVVFGYASGFAEVQVQRGEWFTLFGARVLGTFSARELLESPEKKKQAWEHLQIVMKELR